MTTVTRQATNGFELVGQNEDGDIQITATENAGHYFTKLKKLNWQTLWGTGTGGAKGYAGTELGGMLETLYGLAQECGYNGTALIEITDETGEWIWFGEIFETSGGWRILS